MCIISTLSTKTIFYHLSLTVIPIRFSEISHKENKPTGGHFPFLKCLPDTACIGIFPVSALFINFPLHFQSDSTLSDFSFSIIDSLLSQTKQFWRKKSTRDCHAKERALIKVLVSFRWFCEWISTYPRNCTFAPDKGKQVRGSLITE